MSKIAPEISSEDCPLISVIIPAYNRSHCVLDAITSVRAQTYKNIEIIVIDDGSQDDIIEKLKTCQADEPRLRILKQENGGVSSARNLGIEVSRGRYITFLDSDDTWLPRKLERQLREINRPPVKNIALCFCDLHLHSTLTNERKIRKHSLDDIENRVITGEVLPAISTWMVGRTAFKPGNVGLFDQQMHCSEDYDWMLRFIRRNGQFRLVTEPMARYTFAGRFYKDQEKSVIRLVDKNKKWIQDRFGQDISAIFLNHWDNVLNYMAAEALKRPLKHSAAPSIPQAAQVKT